MKSIKRVVRFVYLSPSDKPFVPAYQESLTRGVIVLQNWFAAQLGGSTFATNEPVAAWYQTSRPASWYEQAPNGELSGEPSLSWYWEKVLDDAFALTGAGFDQPQYRWVFYMDADPGCGQAIGGTSGVALNGANDLRGLADERYVPACPGEPVYEFPWGRWVGGTGHELGHTLGLEHPADSPDGADDRTLMYLGYLDFPETTLRAGDRDVLLASGFFVKV